MIRTLIAQTEEIDDLELAVSEILEQLDIERNLLKNSVGIMTCYLDFIENGIVKAICEKLPFEVAGVNVLNSATSKGKGPLSLSLAVLTSDDVFFSAGISGSLAHGHEEPLKEMYEKASAKHEAKPSLILAFTPAAHYSTAGDYMVNALSTASGGVPVFGLMPSDYDVGFRSPLVIFGGEVYKDSMAVILISGNVNPRFTYMAVPEEKTLRRKAVVTSSQDNIIKEINGNPAVDYLKSVGLIEDDNSISPQVAPIVLYSDDGTDPVVRTLYAMNSEGFPLLGGVAPEGRTIGVGTLDASDVLGMVSKTVASLGEYDFLLVVSCVSRNFILGGDDMAEIDLLKSGLGENAPFMFAYAGGELCPVRAADGALVNQFHNLTLISCAL
ncbi:MAG: FIST C-terminal domain-containing protein [Synergistaceae bacterium]|nr:FIST C-terminal domain-containing protein [Synergistaceae bacterium]